MCCFFSIIIIIFPPLPHKHWAAIGFTEIGQPIGVYTRIRLRLSFENLLQRYGGEDWVVVVYEETHFFPERPVPTELTMMMLRFP